MDTPSPFLMIILLLLFILVGSFFSLAETAITESSKSRLEKLADEGDEDADHAMNIVDSPKHILVTVQIGITFTSIVIGAIAGVMIVPSLAEEITFIPYYKVITLVMTILGTTCITLLFSEILPKCIALQNPEKVLIRFQYILEACDTLTRPFISILSKVSEIILMLFGYSTNVNDNVTEDEIKDLIEQGTEEGTFDRTEQDMVDRIFHLSDETAYSLMTPRTQMFWLDLEDPLPHNLTLIKQHPESFFPVARDNLDDFCGVIYAKDLLNASIDHEKLDLSHFLRKPEFIPRSMNSLDILEKFKSSGVHEAAVLDEYGGVIGFLTLKDIIEEIVGDIRHSAEPESKQITSRDEDSWDIDGLLDIDEFKEKFDIDTLPDEDHDQFHTMGGFLTSYFGHIPQEGDSFSWNGFIFTVEKMDKARIAQIYMQRDKSVDDEASSTDKEQ